MKDKICSVLGIIKLEIMSIFFDMSVTMEYMGKTTKHRNFRAAHKLMPTMINHPITISLTGSYYKRFRTP